MKLVVILTTPVYIFNSFNDALRLEIKYLFYFIFMFELMIILKNLYYKKIYIKLDTN